MTEVKGRRTLCGRLRARTAANPNAAIQSTTAHRSRASRGSLIRGCRLPAAARRFGAPGFALGVVLAAGLGLAGALPGLAMAQTQLTPVGNAGALNGGTVTGDLAASASVHAQVILQPRDPAALAEFVTELSTPGSPEYHHYLARGEFAQDFGATPVTVRAVDAALLAQGLQPGPVSANNLAIPVTTDAQTAQRGFHVHLEQVRLPGGRVGYANQQAPQLPASVAGQVRGVIGLSNLTVTEPVGSSSLTPQPAADAAAAAASRSSEGATASPDDTAATDPTTASAAPGGAAPADATTASATTAAAATSGRGLDQRPRERERRPRRVLGGDQRRSRLHQHLHGRPGRGRLRRRFALHGRRLRLRPVQPARACHGRRLRGRDRSDARHRRRRLPAECFEHARDLHHRAEIDRRARPPPARHRQASGRRLDVDNVIGVAANSNVVVYQGPNSGSGPLDVYAAMINDDTASVITTSWGLCEAQLGASVIQSEADLFAQAMTQGQSIVAASGDDGSQDCDDGTQAVDDPASQPLVTGVGGTTLYAVGPPPHEYVWNTSRGATGGGVSHFWAMPTFQSSSLVAGIRESGYSSGTACGLGTGQYCREVPDVSAHAAGYAIYLRGGWAGAAGTSGSAPLWAGMVALFDATPACAASGDVGFMNPGLYRAAGGVNDSAAFNDVPAGAAQLNNYNQSALNGYPAGTGYDMASGLGTPIAGPEYGNGLAAQLCPPVVPVISSVTPGNASPAGGDTITIHGTGFTPQATVSFGSTPATSVNVSSPTTLTAVAPPGTGTVAVTITTTGGASGVNPAVTTLTYGAATSTTSSSSSSTTSPSTSSTSTSTPTSTQTTSTTTTDTTTSTTSSSTSTTTPPAGTSSSSTPAGGGQTTSTAQSTGGAHAQTQTSSTQSASTGGHTATSAGPSVQMTLHQQGYAIVVGSATCPSTCTVATSASTWVLVDESRGSHTLITVKRVPIGSAHMLSCPRAPCTLSRCKASTRVESGGCCASSDASW